MALWADCLASKMDQKSTKSFKHRQGKSKGLDGIGPSSRPVLSSIYDIYTPGESTKQPSAIRSRGETASAVQNHKQSSQK